MLNNNNFSNRLKIVMDFYNVSASSFAETIDVPRSSISHILSGRNKPSLDFVLKTIETYQEVDLYWLLKGIGNFPKSSHPLPEKKTLITKKPPAEIKNDATASIEPKASIAQNDDTIDKVLVFYKNGTFKEYSKKESS